MDGLAGRVAIVTGGATGLGAGLARSFVRAGVAVVIADIQEDPGRRLQEELGAACLFVATDLSADAHIDRLLAATRTHFGALDFLINAACSYAENGVHSARQAWHSVFDVNLFGHAMLIQKAVPLLAQSPAASVVNFTSASGRIAQMGRWVYPASKAAVEQMTRSAALELAQHGIRVNALLPGMIAKDAPGSPPEEAARAADLASRSNILSRAQSTDEVADTALFLCSSHARFMTGSCLVADGGYTVLGPLGKERHLPKRPPR